MTLVLVVIVVASSVRCRVDSNRKSQLTYGRTVIVNMLIKALWRSDKVTLEIFYLSPRCVHSISRTC